MSQENTTPSPSSDADGINSRNSYSIYDPGPSPQEIIKRLGLAMPEMKGGNNHG